MVYHPISEMYKAGQYRAALRGIDKFEEEARQYEAEGKPRKAQVARNRAQKSREYAEVLRSRMKIL